MPSLPETPGPRFRTLFAAALGVRGAVVVFGLALASLPPAVLPMPDGISDRSRDRLLLGSSRVIEPWFRWDAAWYVALADNGYAGAVNSNGQRGVAFLPALPMCLAAAAAIGLDPFWAGLLLVNLAAAAGTAVFARVAAHLTRDRGIGLRTFVLLQVFPTSFFFSAPYNESFGLLFIALACASWLRNQSLQAGACAAAASLARLTAVGLGVAAVGGWLLDDRTRSGFRRAVVLALGSLVGMVFFWSYLGYTVHDPFAWLSAHDDWGRKRLSPWNPWLALQTMYRRQLPAYGEVFTGMAFAMEGLTALGFAILGIRAWIKRGAFWGLLTLVPIAQLMMSGTFLSAHRVVLASLPAFIELADLLRNRRIFLMVVATFVFLQVFLLNYYVHWRFAG